MKLREHAVQDAIRDAVGRHAGALLRRRQVGTFLAVDGSPYAAASLLRLAGIGARVVEVGDPGEADLQGLAPWIAGYPIPVAVEVKAPGGKLRPAQAQWRDHVWIPRGGIYVLADCDNPRESVEQVLGALRLK